MALTAVEDLTQPSEQAEEAAEPPVEAMPKIGRAAFLYREPRVGLDGKQYYGQCASCQSFVSEASMMGAVSGDRCAKFGSTFPVSDDDHCSLYQEWGSGLPCEGVTSFYAMELRKGITGVSPWMVGYKSKTCVQCRTCHFFDTELAECEAMEDINSRAPNLFEMATNVNAYGWCSLWTPEDAPTTS